MQMLEYALIAALILFTVTFLWLVRVIGCLDCMVSSSIKSAGHCLTLIAEQSEQVLNQEREKRHNRRASNNPIQPKATSTSNHLIPYIV